MVIVSEWLRTAMDQRSICGLPMTDEDTGLEAFASPLAGYLGKVQERAASLEVCPWCTSKGLNYALRSYRINLQESVTLCTNPQCLFPLVSRSLEDVLASLVPVKPPVGSKKRNAVALEEEKPENKRLRPSDQDRQSLTGTLTSQLEPVSVNAVCNGQHAAPKTDSGIPNGSQESQEKDVKDKEPENATYTNGFVSPCSTSAGQLQSSSDALFINEVDECETEEKDNFRQVKNPPETPNRRCILDSSECLFIHQDIHSTKINTPSPQHSELVERTRQKSQTADKTTCKDIQGVKSEADIGLTEADELVAAPSQLFWKNSDNLCWLDSLLVALVNCKILRKFTAKDGPKESSVCRLLRKYEDICASVQAHHRTCKDGIVRVPHHVLQKAEEDLQTLRMSIFKLLQPKLQCKLGVEETPVFAMPLLLTTDSWAEPLFQTTFHWEFKCKECKVAMTERVMKTLPTFTKILSDWHPLHAVHSAPCNVCGKKDQRRTMLMESLPPVFLLHFVEGLPDNDVRVYTFTFKGKRYSVTTVIQYEQQLKHFVTWTRNPDGSWVEYDDLKYPDCNIHHKLPVTAREMHIVLWEAEDDEEPRICSPSSTFTESPPSKHETNSAVCDKDLKADELLASDQSIFMSHEDSDIVCALSASENTTVTAGLDASIGSTTLLDTFEGLSHNDIITLTLVELKPDSESPPQSQNMVTPSDNEILDSTPDSSSAVVHIENSHSHDVELSAPPDSSASEDSSSSDPTFVPPARKTRGAGRGKSVSRQNTKKSTSSKTVLNVSASSELPKVISNKPEDAPAPVENTQQVSPVSSTDASPMCTGKDSPAVPSPLDQNVRWSFLLSQHPLHKSKIPPTPAAQVKKSPPQSYSTPNPVRKPQISGGVFPKPQLKTEKSDGLPLKAAEMYGAFGSKSSIPPSHLPPSVLPCDKSNLLKPLNLLSNTTVTSGTSLSILREKEMSSSGKHSSHSSKIPPGLTSTEALRYRLIKKLKAKKRKLAKLNEMLGHQGGAGLRPDSTDLGSPNTVTSSTYDGSICDDFLSDLLSPATTASNLSPDSTGFLEMLASGQDGAEQLDCRVVANGAALQSNSFVNEPNRDNFLEEFLSQAVAQRSTGDEMEAFSSLDFFV
ncbi:SUMO-specific isopeptidase USPL1 [Cheilinus undulatus]|uniref:SUMO-specific isopeptidase USPL1 n=1 Tax=Cheilinus undulatus TaxID=241271 RepID=UPI001BD31747|nr:SUMO-specific isopeptidase USPL1 [Cheilinus undulatus]XP_041657105.1 SUMO-specific isopeptidase USPL1 [Cheilinus undulatus]